MIAGSGVSVVIPFRDVPPDLINLLFEGVVSDEVGSCTCEHSTLMHDVAEASREGSVCCVDGCGCSTNEGPHLRRGPSF